MHRKNSPFRAFSFSLFVLQHRRLAPRRSTPMQIAADASRSCQPFAAFAIKFPPCPLEWAPGPREREKKRERWRKGRKQAKRPIRMLARLANVARRLHGLSAGQRDKACKIHNYIEPASREPSTLQSLRSLLRSGGVCSRRKTRANLPREFGVGVPRRDVTSSRPIDLMRF